MKIHENKILKFLLKLLAIIFIPIVVLVLIFSIIFFILGASYNYKYRSPSANLVRLWSETTNESVKTKDPTLCLKLQDEYVYISAETKERGAMNAGLKSVETPKLDCLRFNVSQTNDLKTCDLIFDILPSEGKACKTSIAIKNKDLTMCDALEDERCKAIITLDQKYCYNIPKDEHDDPEATYGRGVANCIKEIAEKTKNEKICFEINGPDYNGIAWAYYRNTCIWEAMGNVPEESRCSEMVDTETVKKTNRSKENCLQGNFPW